MFVRPPFAQPTISRRTSVGSFRTVERRHVTKTVVSNHFADLTRIYDDGVNLCLIQRPVLKEIEAFVYAALDAKTSLEVSQPIDSKRFDFSLTWLQAAEIPGYEAWAADVAWLAAAFCELFELRAAGLRLHTLDKAMCPRFHVDRVPARMICSYGGIGTEWLPEFAVDRGKLGLGGCGMPDHESGLITDPTAIRKMPAYAVGLMKGESWEGNGGCGLVHRSPQPTAVLPRRLLLTLDML